MPKHSKDVLQISGDLANQKVGAILRRWQADKSWSQIHGLLRGRRVLLDGNLIQDPAKKLVAGQVLKLLPQPIAPPATEKDVRILYCDTEVIVVEKPSGITSIRHPEEGRWPARRRQLQPTLTELLPRLLARIERSQNRGRSSNAVRAVHRLDRETSGLMVFARNVRAERILGAQFREHTIQRVYRAIVKGHIEQQTIDANLVRDRGDGRRGVAERNDQGKRAVTHVSPVEFLPGFTLVECRLETGRTHQIRIHLAERGHPVCGDKVYGGTGGGRDAIGRSPSRLALHAGRLGFIHPRDDRPMFFESPLPADLVALLDWLRRRPTV